MTPYEEVDLSLLSNRGENVNSYSSAQGVASKLSENNPISNLCYSSSAQHTTLSVKSDDKKSAAKIDNGKMSWRKMVPSATGVESNSTSNKNMTKVKTEGNEEEDEKLPINKDEKYVNDLVKNLLNKIIFEEEKVNLPLTQLEEEDREGKSLNTNSIAINIKSQPCNKSSTAAIHTNSKQMKKQKSMLDW